tara:strand:+ start:1135 stop:1659 length:525 start_codon:yes stop_codon:yes gene_type:complete
MAYTRQYKSFLKPERRIGKSLIRPRNIYRITTYKGGQPATRSGDDARYIFVIGIVDKMIHCIKLNPVKPIDFTTLIARLRDKRIPIGSDQSLELLLKKFSKDGNNLFTTYIKNNNKLYSRSLANYRTYKLDNITNIYEIRFEQDFLQELFEPGSNKSTRRQVIKDEVNEDTDIE